MIRALLACVFVLGLVGEGAQTEGGADVGASVRESERAEETARPRANALRQLDGGGAGRTQRLAAGPFVVPALEALPSHLAVAVAPALDPRPAPALVAPRASWSSRAPPVRPS